MIKLMILTALNIFVKKCNCYPPTETIDDYILKMENYIECQLKNPDYLYRETLCQDIKYYTNAMAEITYKFYRRESYILKAIQVIYTKGKPDFLIRDIDFYWIQTEFLWEYKDTQVLKEYFRFCNIVWTRFLRQCELHNDVCKRLENYTFLEPEKPEYRGFFANFKFPYRCYDIGDSIANE